MAQNRQQQINLEDFDLKKITRKWLIRGGLILVIGSVLLYFIDPGFLNGIFFNFLVEGLPFLLLGIIFFFFVYRALRAYAKNKQGTGLFWIVLAIGTFIFGTIFFSKVMNYYIYQRFAKEVTEVDNYIPIDKDVIRFTPRIVAYNQMESTVRARTETVEWSHCRPYLKDGNFGYVAPITPDGLRPQYLKKNPGFIKYDDDYQSNQVIQRIEQPFEVGEEMQYTDNIFRQLYFNDFFAQYPRIHYMTLGEENKFYAIAPKIKYSYAPPFFFIPYWSGTAIIDQDGNIENLSREEIKKDARFKGKWMAPLKLFYEYVSVQDYAVGFWNTFTSVDGMLSIPDLANNDYPLVIYTADKNTYLVIDTEPQGTGRGLFRVYYQNAQTGDIFMHEPPTTEPIIGPRGAMSKVYSLKGYHWYSANSSGNMLALEPVYLTKNIGGKEVLYWKFSITSLDRTRVSATVVVEATEGGEMFEFTKREDFERWLHSNKIKTTTVDTGTGEKSTSANGAVSSGAGNDARIEKLESLLMEALRELEALKKEKQPSLEKDSLEMK